MIPGTTAKREQSTVSAPERPSPTDAIRPPSIATSARLNSPPPTSTRPPFSTMSAISGGCSSPSRHRRRRHRNARRRAGSDPGDARDVDHGFGRHVLADHDAAEAEQLLDARRRELLGEPHAGDVRDAAEDPRLERRNAPEPGRILTGHDPARPRAEEHGAAESDQRRPVEPGRVRPGGDLHERPRDPEPPR